MNTETWVETKYGYCYYSSEEAPSLIYNLYVHPEHRGHGHSRTLLTMAIEAIRSTDPHGAIFIQASPFDNSPLDEPALTKLYRSLGLTVIPSDMKAL